MSRAMLQLDDQQQAARDWFESLRDRICAAFEEIERESGSDAAFAFTPWERTDDSGEAGGGGEEAVEGRRQRVGRRLGEDAADAGRSEQPFAAFGAGFGEAVGVEGVVIPAALAAAGDDAGVAQGLEVPRQSRLRQPKVGHEVADTALAVE